MLAVSMSPPVALYPAVQRRPKLSLQTSELPITYSSASSRGLSVIATPSAAVTPTTFNTFNNTFDLTHRPSPTTNTTSPSVSRAISGHDRVSQSQSPRPKHSEATYNTNLPYGVKPILKNSLFPGLKPNSISASPRSSTRRVFFPAPKEVVFKNTIEEEIVTKIYTARHSDLFQPDDVEEDEVPESTAIPQISASSESSESGSSISISSSTRRPCQVDIPKVDISTESLSGRIDTDSLQVSTPASTKTRRRWEWTLAPLPQSREEKATAATTSITMPSSPQTKSKSDAPSTQSASEDRSEWRRLRSSSPVCQASAISVDRDSETAPPHLNPHATISLPETSTSSCLTRLKVTFPLPTPRLHPQKQRRGGSLESSPSRKRKAECLDASAIVQCDSTNFDDGNGETESNSASDDIEGTEQTGVKRRERAATL